MSRRTVPGEGSGGRGRPPAHSKFKPGQSGNPRGRPKRSKNTRTLLEAELDQLVDIKENGKSTKATKREVVIKRAVNQAMQGDTRHLIAFLKLFPDLTNGSPADTPQSVLGSDEDQDLLRKFLQQMTEKTDEQE